MGAGPLFTGASLGATIANCLPTLTVIGDGAKPTQDRDLDVEEHLTVDMVSLLVYFNLLMFTIVARCFGEKPGLRSVLTCHTVSLGIHLACCT